MEQKRQTQKEQKMAWAQKLVEDASAVDTCLENRGVSLGNERKTMFYSYRPTKLHL